jgi:hypothetical protein
MLAMARAGFWAIESHTIRFGRDGRWYSDDEEIVNPRIAALFSRHVTRGDDGGWWLRIGDERAPIVVDDTPFVVTRVDGDPDSGFNVVLNDGSSEPLDPKTLRFGANDVLYCDVPQRGVACRFLRPAQVQLLNHVRTENGWFVLPLPAGGVQRIQQADGS